MKVFIVAATVLAVLSAGCGNDDGAGVRNIGPTPSPGTATGSGSATGTGTGSHTAAPPAFPEAEANTVVHVDLTEYSITVDVTDIVGPKVFLEVTNKSKINIEHELYVTPSRATDDAAAIAEVHAFPAGDERDLAVELQPGTYQFACFLKEPDDHYAEGMHVEVTVK